MADAGSLIRKLQDAHAKATLDNVGSFEALTHPLTELADQLRESYQASVAGPILAMIGKLRKGGALTQLELDLAESFIAGDAEAYTRLENDFQSWVLELGRLMKVLGGMSANLKGKVLLDAVGEVDDARRVLGDICNYLEEKQRVVSFRRTTAQGLDAERSALLADLLEQHLTSADL
jgi:hypothetical protein